MSGVFRNIDPPPPPPHRPTSMRGEDTLAGWRWGGGGVNSSEDARHCSVLYMYICRYFVGKRIWISHNVKSNQLFTSCLRMYEATSTRFGKFFAFNTVSSRFYFRKNYCFSDLVKTLKNRKTSFFHNYLIFTVHMKLSTCNRIFFLSLGEGHTIM